MNTQKFYSVLFVLLISIYGQAQKKTWNIISDKEIVNLPKMDRVSMPEVYQVFKLDLQDLTANIQNAPSDITATTSHVIVSFPTSNGSMERFEIYKAPIMSPILSQKFPGITSYSGKSIEDPTSTIRFSITSFGLQAVHYSEKMGTNYIDAYTTDLKNYISYNRNDLKERPSFQCTADTTFNDISNSFKNDTPLPIMGTHVFREYRLAMACTIEYAAFHLAQAQSTNIPLNTLADKKAVVLSAMVATMTRVNFIFERDLSIRMNLVDNNDAIIFIDSDNFNNNNPGQLLNQSQSVINSIIQSPNYDIGHTVSTGGGGLARLETPCRRTIKAMGITGSPRPIGDAFDVDYVAHEMGHQFGATHTFSNSCDGNIQEETAVETGSGSTIMAYAGICAPNVQPNSNPYFHAVSIAQINDFITQRGLCSQNTDSEVPTLEAYAGPNYNIPYGTPFKLTGTSNQDSFQNITYSWEQTDAEETIQPPLSSSKGGPSFKTYSPSRSNSRYFPNFQSVLSGENPTWEVLPTVKRTLNFSFIVRDNDILLGGQTAESTMKVDVANKGPFAISYPNASNVEWQANSTQVITWNLGGTTADPINTTHVNILFSGDGGQTFSILKENTPNDGTESVIAPDYNSSDCRIMIQPVDNIYYTVSKSFKVLGGTASTFSASGLSDFKLFPNPTSEVFYIQFKSASTEDVTILIHDLRGRLIASNSYQNTGDFNQEIKFGNAQPGIYLVTVMDGKNKEIKKIIKK